MPQRCRQAGFLQQIIRLVAYQVGLQALDRNGSLQGRIPGLMHVAKPTIAKQLAEAIALGTGRRKEVGRRSHVRLIRSAQAPQMLQ